MGQKYCVNNNSHTSEPNEFVILINYWITGKNDRQTSEPELRTMIFILAYSLYCISIIKIDIKNTRNNYIKYLRFLSSNIQY